MATPHVRIKILAAMMAKPEQEWTRHQLMVATGLDHTNIVKSAAAAINAGYLTLHRGEHHSSPVRYTLTHTGRQWGIAYTTQHPTR